MQLVLSYFNPIIGPEILLAHPGSISENVSKKMTKFFDLDMPDKFFEVTLIEEDLKLTNLFFEITSCWARGKKEMVMLSTISEKDYESEYLYEILKELSEKITSRVNIYKAFYTKGYLNENDPEINLKREELETCFLECYEKLEDQLKGKATNEKIVKKFKKFEW